jgi:DnaJ-class molecular chaperone
MTCTRCHGAGWKPEWLVDRKIGDYFVYIKSYNMNCWRCKGTGQIRG